MVAWISPFRKRPIETGLKTGTKERQRAIGTQRHPTTAGVPIPNPTLLHSTRRYLPTWLDTHVWGYAGKVVPWQRGTAKRRISRLFFLCGFGYAVHTRSSYVFTYVDT